jgi:hypothetical protein
MTAPTPARLWTEDPDRSYAEAVSRSLGRIARGDSPRRVWPGDYPR